MKLAMIGLGRMGASLTRRLMRGSHECVVYDLNRDAVAELEHEGAIGAATLADLAGKLPSPRVVWIMVPASLTDPVIDELADVLGTGDIVIDGGHGYYRDDVARTKRLRQRGIEYVDVGTSGGVFGLQRGFSLMIGGEPATVEYLRAIFAALAPGCDAAPRTPGRTDEPSDAEHGFLHCGPAGAGHFVKMVHNGIEYGIMAAYAEGLAVLRNAGLGEDKVTTDADSAPLRDSQFFRYELDTTEVSEVWRRGSVIGSWLLDLTAATLLKDPDLSGFSGRVSDSGEGRWTVEAALQEGVPAHVLTAALYERFSSRGEADFANRLLSGMRKEFGGHIEVNG
jgi:6-phosphogluconate dehydrogenase